MNIIGISCFYHDSAVALVQDGVLTAAAQEERFTRLKHDHGFPHFALEYCLRQGGLTPADVDIVAFYEKPTLKFTRVLENFMQAAPRGFTAFVSNIPSWLSQKLHMRHILRDEIGGNPEIIFLEHHESHVASAFYPSPFDEAAILTVDGVGEWDTTTLGVGRKNDIQISHCIRYPHSLGLLYSAFTYYLGFKINSGEYKVMGLAPYGEPTYVDLIMNNLIDLKSDGSFKLNLDYFEYQFGRRTINAKFCKLFGGPERKPETTITQKEFDLARSIQVVIEEAMLRIARHLNRQTGLKKLCMAGGVALNCVANGRIIRETPFEDVFIQPAAGDAGGAAGAAYFAWHKYLGQPREKTTFRTAYLGPAFSADETARTLDEAGAVYEKLGRAKLIERVADLLAQENVVGWFNGRMEYGPRALGARSIIGDARSPKMQSVMNLKIKYRESFRPFAPSVLLEKAPDYFEFDSRHESPYMLLVADVRKHRRVEMTEQQQKLFGIEKLNVPRSDVPAITHVDYSARLQTVKRDDNPDYYDLIAAFERQTGCPVVINTSFNVRGEPIVCTPRDAYRCFMRTEMDYLVIDNFFLSKKDQPNWTDATDWKEEFALD